MPRPRNKVPSYLLHAPSGQARVRINGRDVYLGPHGSARSKEAYARLIAETYSTNGTESVPTCGKNGISIAALIVKYDDHARIYYTKGGAPTDERYRIKAAVQPLLRLYASTAAGEFGPKRLKAVRDELVKSGYRSSGKPLRRKYVNDLVACIKRLFRWAVSEELVPPSVYEGLRAVPSLRRGKAIGVSESQSVKPVPEEHIGPVLEQVSPQIASMIRLQLISGMRPDEVTIMRPCDVDRSSELWVYRPFTHKTEHHGIEKAIILGPKAKAILEPWLNREPTAYMFSPREVWETWLARKRKPGTKVSARKRTGRHARMRQPRDHYDDESYCQAVERACIRAKVPKWTPGRLRHNAGTNVRKIFGAEAAQLVLGHQNLSTTEIYAEKDRKRYAEIMNAIG
jgi:integrase